MMPAEVELQQRIGEGGLADVFEGTWNGQVVALKVLREPDRPGLRKRFVREGRLLRRFDHPGLVRCLAVLDGPQPVLVLELLRGSSLDVSLRHGPLAVSAVVDLAAETLRILAYLHEQGITHRDVKPSNLFLTDDGRVVLFDLGLAADEDDPLTTTLGDILGTHAYMAPEQIAGAESDHRCDLYSLGITLYEAVCGDRPYHASGLAGYLLAHRSGGATPVIERAPTVPVRLAALIDRLMARDPAARPPSATAALALLTGSRGPRQELSPARMVGREAAIGAMQAVLDGGGLLRVSGELGCGLGTVARHALELARAEGFQHALVRCRARSNVTDILADLARDIVRITGPVPADMPGILTAISNLIGEDGGFLVVAEDLDLATDAVASIFIRLGAIPGATVIVFGRSFVYLNEGRELVLRPLTSAEVRLQLASQLNTPNLPPGLDQAIFRTSGGLPAIVSAIVHEQVARGTIWCDSVGEDGRPHWLWDSSAPLTPGQDVTRLFDRALRTLPVSTRALVQTLAVAGEPVPLDLLLSATSSDPSGLGLGPALRHGLVAVELRQGEEWVSLRRAVLEPILINTLDDDTERGVHLVLADAARVRPMREWEQRFILLHLALGAREAEDTTRLVELGEWLTRSGRPVEALEVLNSAAGLPVEDSATLARLALSRADGLMQLGRLSEARAALEAGRGLAAGSDQPEIAEHAVLAHFELSMLLGTRVPEEARPYLPPEAPAVGPLRVRRLLAAAAIKRCEGDLDRAAELYADAIDRAPPGPVDRIGVAARLSLARIVAERGEPGRATGMLRALVAELRAVDRALVASEALVALAEIHTVRGQLGLAAEALRLAGDLSEGSDAPWAGPAILVGRASLALAGADMTEAGDLLASAAACGEPAAPWPLRRRYLAVLAEQREMAGDNPSALTAHVRAVEDAGGIPDVLVQAFHSGMIGVLTAAPAALGAAVDRLAESRAIPALARLLLLGGVTSRDREVLEAAEAEARASEQIVLLLRVQDAIRAPASRVEARQIVQTIADGVFGLFRERFLASPAARWALGERATGRRDTGG
jgi:hypothetical protein